MQTQPSIRPRGGDVPRLSIARENYRSRRRAPIDVSRIAARVGHEPGEQVLAALAATQHGLVDVAQLAALGWTASMVHNRCRRGLLTRMHRGVYLVARDRPTRTGRVLAAVLAAGAHSLAAHRSALELWGALPQGAGEPHVVTPDRRAHEGIVVHQSACLAPRDCAALDHLPLTSPARSLLDFAGDGDSAALETAMNELRIAQLLPPRDLDDLRGRARGHHGWGPLNALLAAEGDPGFSRSEAERRMRRLIRDAALPPPRRNVRVGGWEVDFLWPDGRLIVEIDGYAFHSGRRSFERDRTKQTELQGLGYEVLRFTWKQLTLRPSWVVARLASALARRAVP